MRKLIALAFIFIICHTYCFGQNDMNQNGIKSTVIDLISTETQALRFPIASISYNSHHWQNGGIVMIELFQKYFENGYAKYFVEVGFGQGGNYGSAPVLKLIEGSGTQYKLKVTLGNPVEMSSEYGGYVDKALPVYVDLSTYTRCVVKLTYLQTKVENLFEHNQIRINSTPAGSVIPDFSSSIIADNNLSSSKLLMVTGSGSHYIQNGNLSIGTTDSKGYRLAVAGNMIAESVKVKLQGVWPDFVFSKSYKLPTLQETEKHVKENGHLPGIPSAAEVQANGIDLGDMNAKLLEKIEELTLHLIEKNKELKSQDARIKKLEEFILKR